MSSATKVMQLQDDLQDLTLWRVVEHVNGRVLTPDESYKRWQGHPISLVEAEGRRACCLAYRFDSQGHDAVMISKDGLQIRDACRLAVDVGGDGSGNRLFAVLCEESGEHHVLESKPVVDWEGFRTVSFDLASLRISPPPHAVEPFHWGGDGNQKLDDPIVGVTIGIADRSDAYMSAGQILIAAIRFMENT